MLFLSLLFFEPMAGRVVRRNEDDGTYCRRWCLLALSEQQLPICQGNPPLPHCQYPGGYTIDLTDGQWLPPDLLHVSSCRALPTRDPCPCKVETSEDGKRGKLETAAIGSGCLNSGNLDWFLRKASRIQMIVSLGKTRLRGGNTCCRHAPICLGRFSFLPTKDTKPRDLAC